jgi:hypothetical protein
LRATQGSYHGRQVDSFVLRRGRPHHEIMGRILLVVGLAVAVLAWGCNPLGHCSPGYDDQTHHVSVCDGNIASGRDEVCSDVSNETRDDCGTHGQVCLGGACVTPCTADSDCPATSYCALTPDAWDHRDTCKPRVGSGENCAYRPSACADGYVCQNNICHQDCSKTDPAAQTCTRSFCDGKAVRTCDECGVPGAVTTTCSDGSTAPYCIELPTGAFCAAEPDADPKCGTSGYATYCAGNTFVQCQGGYAIHRVACPVETACGPTGCTSAR